MNLTLKEAVESENEQDLMKCLSFDFRQNERIGPGQYYLIEKALAAIWHSQHEDLVNTIYLDDLRDDRFVEPIMKIALNRDIYRCHDDELEPTLRKCVHALRTINSKKSNEALKKLESLENDNVRVALDMYS